MQELYLLAKGPLLWISGAVFVLGLIWRTVAAVRLLRSRDAAYLAGFQPSWAGNSILRWLLPLNITAQASPGVTLAGFVFHGAFLALALFLSAHVILWDQAFGLSWFELPDHVSDALTLAFLAAAAFFALRRLGAARVKALTTAADWLVLVLAVLPPLTGFLAQHQFGPYAPLMVLHVLSGDLLLLAAPFTKLSHMALFFVSRAVVGSDFGRRKVGAW